MDFIYAHKFIVILTPITLLLYGEDISMQAAKRKCMLILVTLFTHLYTPNLNIMCSFIEDELNRVVSSLEL